MDNLTDYQRKRYELLTNIQKMVASDFSDKDIALALGISDRTVRRNKHCDPKRCCRSENSSSEIYNYKNRILKLISEGYHATGIAKKLKDEGCSLAISTIRRNAVKFAKEYDFDICKCRKGAKLKSQKELKKIIKNTVTIRKADLIKFLWMNDNSKIEEPENLYQKYPKLLKIKTCINEFRQIFIKYSLPLLHLFMERYERSKFVPIVNFVKGLKKDINAVENAVVSPLSNGFVEGVNNKIKMIKRVMYGRCGIELLSAKIILPYAQNG